MARESWEQLLAVEHEEGVAAVLRDRADGSYVLSGTVEHGGSRMTQHRFAFEGLRDGWVQAGFLPYGAARVRVRDGHGSWTEAAVGNGVWLAVTRAAPLAVRFEDATGRIVPRPLHALERAPAPDATAPCAACGATGWDVALLVRVYPGDSERRAVVCRRCGHQVDMGIWHAGPGDIPMDPQPPADWCRQGADGYRHVFANARFPVYGVAAWGGARAWRGHGTRLGVVDQVRLGHTGPASVDVETRSERNPESPRRQIERALEQLATPRIAEEAWRRLSPAALEVQMEQDRLRAGERVAAVVTEELTIPVDGRPRRFLAARYGEHWAALAALDDGGELTVLMTAGGIAPEAIALERVRDIEPYLEPPAG